MNILVNSSAEIERMRAEMISVGMAKGFGHQDTLKLSQELDRLIISQMKSNEVKS